MNRDELLEQMKRTEERIKWLKHRRTHATHALQDIKMQLEEADERMYQMKQQLKALPTENES